MAGTVVGELGELVDRCRKAALVDVSLGDNDDLRQAVSELESARAAIDAAQGHCLAELEARDACDVDVGLSTISWLTWTLRLSRRQAAVRVKVANRLRRELSGVDAALGDGRISFDHARVLADAANPRVAEVIAGVQDHLVDAATRSPFDIWAREVRALVELVDQDGGHDPAADFARNRLHLDDIGGGTTVVRGELVGDTALGVQQAVEHKADELFRRYQADQKQCPELVIPSRSTLRALALAELVRHGLVADPTSSAPVADITLVIDAANGTVTTPDGRPIDPRTCSHLFCDPVLHTLYRDSPSIPLDLKRSVRFATPHQRRVLAVRDRGCVFPGCGCQPSWCDAHHLTEWDHGGETDMINLALLCRHHHGVVHRKGWSMSADPAGGFTFTTPAGRVLTSRSPSPP